MTNPLRRLNSQPALPILARGRPNGKRPFSWTEKRIRREIRGHTDGSSLTIYVLGVYDALAEIASDEQSDSFNTLHSHIASMAGCSVAQVKRALRELIEIGAVLVETPRMKGPCTYHLLRSSDAVGLSEPTIAPIEPTIALNENYDSRATVEESKNNHLEETQKIPPSPPRGDASEGRSEARRTDSDERTTAEALYRNYYPSKSGDRERNLEAIIEALRAEGHEALLHATKRYADSNDAVCGGGRRVPTAAKWFGGGGYKEFLPRVAQAPKTLQDGYSDASYSLRNIISSKAPLTAGERACAIYYIQRLVDNDYACFTDEERSRVEVLKQELSRVPSAHSTGRRLSKVAECGKEGIAPHVL